MAAPWLDGAIGLASATSRSLDDERAALVLLADGRLGYATATAFRLIAWGEDVDLVTVNTGDDRAACVLSLLLGLGEVREVVPESAAVVTRRFREAGWQVSAQQLGPPGDEPPAEPVEHPGDDSASDREDRADPEATGTGGDGQTRAERETTKAAGRLSGRAAAFLGRGTLALLRTAVLTGGGVVVGILLIEVLLTLAGANPLNGLVRFFHRTSTPLAWQFKDLFTPRTVKANIAENDGIAAVVYLLVALAVARVLARLGSLSR